MTEKLGRYIVIEGSDGTGKSTQAELLVNNLKIHGINASQIEEPGATPIGAELRQIIKNGQLDRSPNTNLLLFTADRLETWNNIIKPSLDAGGWIVSARNWFSTVVYQGYGEGLEHKTIEDTTRRFVGDHYTTPDLSIVLTHKDSQALKERIQDRAERGLDYDNFENKPASFQESLAIGYEEIARSLGDIAINIDGLSIETVEEKIWASVKKNFDIEQ